MQCKYCNGKCIRYGKQCNGYQKYFCKLCKKYQQSIYKYQACYKEANKKIALYTKESCGIRSISRIMNISATTVIHRIKEIARAIKKPFIISKGKEYEMDEMRTYIKKKENRYWIAYAIRRDTREVVDLKVGRRNKKTLTKVTDTLLLSGTKTSGGR